MKNTKVYVDFITEKLKNCHRQATRKMPLTPKWARRTTKGGLLVQLAKGCEKPTSSMVAEVKGNGRLRLTG